MSTGGVPTPTSVHVFIGVDKMHISDFNIIEIGDMINHLEYIASSTKTRRVEIVGGMTGSEIFRHAIEAVMVYFKFDEILIVEGCQDYIGLDKKNRHNHVYYADLLTEDYVDPLVMRSVWEPVICKPKSELIKLVDAIRINKYKFIIINDAHLVPWAFIDEVNNRFVGNVLAIVDPFDVRGEFFQKIPTICESLDKLSILQAMARQTYDVDTLHVDRDLKHEIIEVRKINKRALGKIDDKQYITNDPEFCERVQRKQYRAPLRKNQKLIVKDDGIYTSMVQGIRGRTLTRNSMCVMVSSRPSPLMKLKIYAFNEIFHADVSYNDNPPEGVISVKPANILMINDSIYHRYNNAVLILNGKPITQRQKYSILKNCNNLVVTHF